MLSFILRNAEIQFREIETLCQSYLDSNSKIIVNCGATPNHKPLLSAVYGISCYYSYTITALTLTAIPL